MKRAELSRYPVEINANIVELYLKRIAEKERLRAHWKKSRSVNYVFSLN